MQKVLEVSPELRDQMVAAVDARITDLQQVRAELTGSKQSRGRRSNGNKETHGAAVLQVLSLPEAKSGIRSREIGRLAKEKFDHNFGKSLGTTLNNLCTASQPKISWKPVDPKAKKSQYIYSLAK